MWVVKLGGSLLRSGSLDKWLELIVKNGAGKLVIVPGGGVFAEQIRKLQRSWGFDDKAAHHMAMLAMEQYASLLQSRAPELTLIDNAGDLVDALEQQQLPVWLPVAMASRCGTLPQSWDVSSDSLALWLAERLKAQHLILIKSVQADGMSLRKLAAVGRVDSYFPQLAGHSKTSIWWLENGQSEYFSQVLKDRLALPDCCTPVRPD